MIPFQETNRSDQTRLCHYDAETKQLTGNQIIKAKKFLELNLIKEEFDGVHIIKPIKGYNKTKYRVIEIGGRYFCNCQYNSTKGLECSHILAVKMKINQT